MRASRRVEAVLAQQAGQHVPGVLHLAHRVDRVRCVARSLPPPAALAASRARP